MTQRCAYCGVAVTPDNRIAERIDNRFTGKAVHRVCPRAEHEAARVSASGVLYTAHNVSASDVVSRDRRMSEAIHSSAVMLHKVGAIDKTTMADFDARYLVPKPHPPRYLLLGFCLAAAFSAIVWAVIARLFGIL